MELSSLVKQLFLGDAPKNILFRVDAGRIQGLSYGHLSRCILLAAHCIEQFQSFCWFLINNDKTAIDYLKKHIPCSLVHLPLGTTFDDETAVAVRLIRDNDIDWMVHDLPYEQINENLFQNASLCGVKTLFIDDNRYLVPNVSVILNSSINAPQHPNYNGAEASLFLGIEYFLFRENNLTNESPQDNSVLLTFGGSDPSGLTIKLLKVLAMHGSTEWQIGVLCGPGFSNQRELKALKNDFNIDLTLHEKIKDPNVIFNRYKLILCGGGRTMYELFMLKKTFVPIASAPHEIGNIENFKKHTSIKYGIVDDDYAKVVEILKWELDDGAKK